MLALFCGTAALPHIVARQALARDPAQGVRATGLAIAIVAVLFVGFFYLGIEAAATPCLDSSDPWSAAPRLALAMGGGMSALFSAFVLLSILGTACGLTIAGARVVTHQLLGREQGEGAERSTAQMAVIGVSGLAVILGILCRKMDWAVLLEWGLTLAAAALLPALVLMSWKRVTVAGIVASVVVGGMSTLAWELLSPEAFRVLLHQSATEAAKASPLPFMHAGLVTIPLAFVTLVVVSLASGGQASQRENATAAH
jgi:cation/acetate symporter